MNRHVEKEATQQELAETSLNLLGLGLREPIESSGVLLYAARNVRAIAHMPWRLIPGTFVILAVPTFSGRARAGD